MQLSLLPFCLLSSTFPKVIYKYKLLNQSDYINSWSLKYTNSDEQHYSSQANSTNSQSLGSHQEEIIKIQNKEHSPSASIQSADA